MEGTFAVGPAKKGACGPVRAEGIHFVYDDGTPGYFFGTTVYAMLHQEDALIDETLETLQNAPFNKIRLCVFPKHYEYSHYDPKYYPFARRADGSWDPDHPCFAFWEAFEKRLLQLFALGIQVDLILFHPYDRWGFSKLPQRGNLDYLLRRFSAFPNLWWSMANEYDLFDERPMADWYEIEDFLYGHDPYRHLLSCHNIFQPYDPARPHITHLSWQTRQITRTGEMQERYGKPVSIDECSYEGDLPQN